MDFPTIHNNNNNWKLHLLLVIKWRYVLCVLLFLRKHAPKSSSVKYNHSPHTHTYTPLYMHTNTQTNIFVWRVGRRETTYVQQPNTIPLTHSFISFHFFWGFPRHLKPTWFLQNMEWPKQVPMENMVWFICVSLKLIYLKFKVRFRYVFVTPITSIHTFSRSTPSLFHVSRPNILCMPIIDSHNSHIIDIVYQHNTCPHTKKHTHTHTHTHLYPLFYYFLYRGQYRSHC